MIQASPAGEPSPTAATIAQKIEIEFEGRKLQLQPLDTTDYARIGEHIVAKRPNLLKLGAEAMSAAPEEMRSWMWSDVLRESKASATITTAEVLEYISTSIEGMGYAVWLQLEKAYPGEFDIKAAYRVLESVLKQGLAGLTELARQVAASRTEPEQQPAA
jgi:hypothetical protein